MKEVFNKSTRSFSKKYKITYSIPGAGTHTKTISANSEHDAKSLLESKVGRCRVSNIIELDESGTIYAAGLDAGDYTWHKSTGSQSQVINKFRSEGIKEVYKFPTKDDREGFLSDMKSMNSPRESSYFRTAELLDID